MKIFFIFFGNPKTCCIFAMPEPARPLNNAQMRGSFYFIYVLIRGQC